MGWFSLPATQADSKAAFYDSESAAAWLSEQPQANPSLMLASLVDQIEAFNACYTGPRERFKTMEVLRNTLFAVSADCQRRFENKPLPLLPAEQHAFASVRRLWAACTLAYLHCLNACIERDPTIAHHGARVAHRVLACLRMEQSSTYLGGAELAETFWRTTHGVYGAAEELGATRVPVTDRLLGDRTDSTVSDQYCMLVLLHLAWPYTLTRAQLLAVSRWFARWREQVAVVAAAATGARAFSIAIDLMQDSPVHTGITPPRAARWLSVGHLLGKIQRRLKLLADGESPESLKLGSGLSAAACTALLTALNERLQNPKVASPSVSSEGQVAFAAAGLASIHYLLGGRGLHDPIETTLLSANQIAIFGHVVRAPEESLVDMDRPETWRVTRQDSGELHLLRAAGNGDSRLALKALLAIQLPQPDHFRLATVSGLYARPDGSLCLAATLLAGRPEALNADVREKPAGKLSRHPAFLLRAPEDGRALAMLVPTGLPARSLGIRFFKDREEAPLALGLADVVERGADYERWALSAE
jgi:cyclic-di-GMP-binding protein